MTPRLLLQPGFKHLVLFFTFLGYFSWAQVPVPTAASPQTFCEGATVSNLQASGTGGSSLNLLWYLTADSDTPLAGNTPLQYGQKYYVAEHRTSYMNHVTTLGGGLGAGRSDVVADGSNNLYITDGNVIKKYDAASGTISVYAGTGVNGSQDGKAGEATFALPGGLAIDAAGNLYVADTGNGKIRMIDTEGIVTTIAGAGGQGDQDGPAATALFNNPYGITIDADGTLYIADFLNHKIRVIKNGEVQTLAGNGSQGLADGTGTNARFYFPFDITIDAGGDLYVADNMNARIRKISAGGMVSTIFNTNAAGFNPIGVAGGAVGTVYVTGDNHRIFKVSYNSGSGQYEGELFAGTLEGDIDGIYSAARIRNPQGITVGGNGDIYFAELSNKVKKVYNQLGVEYSGRREVEVILSLLSVNITLDASLTATAHAVGLSDPFTYSWSPSGATTRVVSGLAPGQHTVTVTDMLGCTASSSVTLTTASLEASITSSVNVSCLGSSNGSAAVFASGGTEPYSYLWSNGATTDVVSGLQADTYSVTVTDANGSTATTQVTITEPEHRPTITVTGSSDASCHGLSDGTLDLRVRYGLAPYTYQILNGSGTVTVTGDSTAQVTGLAAGNYNIRVIDAAACPGIQYNVPVGAPLPISVEITGKNDASAIGGADGSATIQGVGGTSPYSYAWSHGPTTNTVTGLSAGNYSATVTDANGCTADTVVSISVSSGSALSVAITESSHISCFGETDGSATALASGGTAPYSYLWSNGATTSRVTGLSAGSYTVTVTDAGNNEENITVHISEPDRVRITLQSQENVTCHGGSDGSAILKVKGGTGGPYTYDWVYNVISGDLVPENDSIVKAINLSAQVFVLLAADANGCSTQQYITITTPVALTAEISDYAHISAPGASDGRATVEAGGGTAPYSYLWSNGATTAEVTGLAGGNYNVTVTDDNGCTATSEVLLSEGAVALSVVITDIAHITCSGVPGGKATASASGGTAPYSYEWSNGATTPEISGVSGGTYSVTVTDATGATATTNVNLHALGVLNLFVNSATHISCNGGSDGQVLFKVRGGVAPYTYEWVTGSGNLSVQGDSFALATNLKAQFYRARVTDANGCTRDRDFGLSEPDPLTVSITDYDDVSSPGVSDGRATAEADGGTAPYSYLWSNGATTAEVTGLSKGNYTVTVTDDIGCKATTPVSISDPTGPALLSVTITNSTNASCSGPSNGSATAAASGGVEPYTYEWSNGALTAAITGLSPGTYTVTATDAVGSTATAELTITVSSSVNFDYVSHSHPQSCGGSDGSIAFTVQGLTSVLLSYEHNGNETQVTLNVISGGFILNNLPAGIYGAFRILDQGCIYTLRGAVTTVTLNNPAAPGTVITPGGPTELCEDDQVTLSASEGASYLWSTGQTTRSIAVATAGTYKVTVTSAQGCESEAAITVTQKVCNLPPVAVCKSHVVLVAGSDCYAMLTPKDLDGGSYDPNGDWTRHTLLNTDGFFRPGNYTVTYEVMDPRGAFSTCEARVEVVDHTPPVALARGLTLELNANGQASISPADVDAGSHDNCGPVTLSLNRTHFDCSDPGHLQVRLTVTDASGNVAEAIADITIVDYTPPVIQAKDVTLRLDENGRATLSAEGLISGVSDNCGIGNVSASQTEFSCEHLGQNQVFITAEDVRGNRSTAMVTVTVQDSIPPVISTQNISLYLDAAGKATLTAEQVDAGSRDNCALVNLSIDRETFDCNDIGEQRISFTATDAAGNFSEASVIVSVRDTLAPVVLALDDITLYLDAAGKVLLIPEDIDQGSSDNCGIAERQLQYSAFDCSHVGTRPVEYTVTDDSGNTTTVLLQVTVRDTIAPEALPRNAVVELDWNGSATLSAEEVDDGSIDNCGIAEMRLSQTDFSCNDLGRRLLTFVVRDVNGNESTTRAVVEVKDPNGVCPCSYGVLAFEGITLKSNEVTAGGVGVIAQKRKVKLRNTVINREGTFVKAPQSRFDQESEASIYIRGAAPQPEGFRKNGNKDKKTEKVGKSENRTLTAGRYGKIKAGKDATLTFSGGEVFIRSLKVKKNASLVFSDPTVLLVRNHTKLGKSTAVNTAGQQVRIYSGGNITVGNASEVRGYLHTQGRLKTRRGREVTSLEGLFVANRIKGGSHTHWAGGGVLCSGNEEPEPVLISSRREEPEPDRVSHSDSTGIRVNLWPNPVITNRLKVSVESDTAGGEWLLVDMQGNIMERKAYTGHRESQEIDMSRAVPGIYILRVISGGKVKALRVVKEGK